MVVEASRISIQRTIDAYGDCVTAYYAKGHVDPEEFISTLEDEEERTGNVLSVRKTYMRKTPVAPGSDYVIDFWINEVDGPARGAYPVTMIDSEDTLFMG